MRIWRRLREQAATLWQGARPQHLSLALQGGGSFGAFTWGVLDRLMDEPGMGFDAVSGASAGAVNAVLLAAGLMEGGPSGAKAKLETFWRRMSRAAPPALSPAMRESLALYARYLSPYQFNPFNFNPLRDALVDLVDFARLNAESPVRLLIGATRVRDGGLHIFKNGDLSVDAVLASACLPLLHHTVEVDGESYWDGGYAANPPVIPLALASRTPRLLVVQVTPTLSDKIPTSPADISRRLDQIHFNATLNRELEALKYGKLMGASPRLSKLRIGRISASEEIAGLAQRSAAELNMNFLERLRSHGNLAAERWLRQELPATPAGLGLPAWSEGRS